VPDLLLSVGADIQLKPTLKRHEVLDSGRRARKWVPAPERQASSSSHKVQANHLIAKETHGAEVTATTRKCQDVGLSVDLSRNRCAQSEEECVCSRTAQSPASIVGDPKHLACVQVGRAGGSGRGDNPALCTTMLLNLGLPSEHQ